ncbi:MAG: transposase [Leptospiraceae bacterium]|nr:transposase [Leptospiraceae bacterium]
MKQHSKLSNTPFRNLRIPQAFAGWAIEESYIRHPKVLTAMEIQKQLGISYKSALNLKRRIQIMACQMMPVMKRLIRKELEQEFPKDWKLPPDGENVTPHVYNKNVVHADTLVLYSMKDRYGRKRHKNKGLTSSIYRSDKLGGEQVGTLVHQITNGKWVLLDSIPNLTANVCGPIIKESLPRNTCLFTDRDYTWLYRIYPNHRMVNHSLKSSDKRFKYSRDRWCQNGVHNQKSEGLNNSIKTAFRSYTFTNPKFSTMYLNEWSFFRNLRCFGLEELGKEKASEIV